MRYFQLLSQMSYKILLPPAAAMYTDMPLVNQAGKKWLLKISRVQCNAPMDQDGKNDS